MRILITGSRKWTDYDAIVDAIECYYDDHCSCKGSPYTPCDELVIIHGDCPTGADELAQKYCDINKIKTERYPADWSLEKKAGPLRNQSMVDTKPDVCLAFKLSDSRGTVDCIKRAKEAGIPVIVYEG